MPQSEQALLDWLARIPRERARLVASAVDSGGVGRIRVDVSDHPLRLSYREPGQFAALGLPDQEARFFAVARDPRSDGVAEFLVAPGQAVADALLAAAAGDLVSVSGAIGDGYGVAGLDGGDLVVVAAGTGIASLRPVLAAIAAGTLRPATARLYYGVRREGEWSFAEDFADWRAAGVDVVTLASESAGPLGGLVTDRLRHDLDAMRGHDNPARAAAAHYLVCGPDPMQKATVRLLSEHGVDSDHIHFNY